MVLNVGFEDGVVSGFRFPARLPVLNRSGQEITHLGLACAEQMEIASLLMPDNIVLSRVLLDGLRKRVRHFEARDQYCCGVILLRIRSYDALGVNAIHLSRQCFQCIHSFFAEKSQSERCFVVIQGFVEVCIRAACLTIRSAGNWSEF